MLIAGSQHDLQGPRCQAHVHVDSVQQVVEAVYFLHEIGYKKDSPVANAIA